MRPTITGMTGWASAASVYGLERRVRAALSASDDMRQWQAAEVVKRSHLAVGAVAGVAIVVGGSQDVVVQWPGGGFTHTEYEVDIVPTGLLGKGAWQVAAQDESSVTVRITATLLIAVGAQFLVYGYG